MRSLARVQCTVDIDGVQIAIRSPLVARKLVHDQELIGRMKKALLDANEESATLKARLDAIEDARWHKIGCWFARTLRPTRVA